MVPPFDQQKESQDTHFVPQTWQQLRPNPPPLNTGILTWRQYGSIITQL